MIGRWWRKRLRDFDRRILWSEFERQSQSENQLLVSLAIHIKIDPAWRYPEEWKDEELELYQFIKEQS